jgi:hypothetical protein
MCRFVFLSLFVLISNKTVAFSQEIKISEPHAVWVAFKGYTPNRYIWPTEKGYRISPSSRSATESSFSFFNCPTIKEQLELTKAQEFALGIILTEWESDDKQFEKELQDLQLNGKDTTAVVNEALEASAEYCQRVERVLLPHQMTRVSQLQIRSLIVAVGPGMALCNTTLRDIIGLSHAEISRVMGGQREIGDRITEKYRKQRCEAIDQWMKVLDDDQKKLFMQRWGHLYQFDFVWTGMLKWQLELSEDSKLLRYKDNIQLKSYFDMPNLMVDVDGSIKTISWEYAIKKHLEFSALTLLLQNPRIASEINFDQRQKEEFNLLVNRFRSMIEAKRNELIALQEGKSLNKSQYMEIEEFKETIGSEVLEQAKKITTPNQLEALNAQVRLKYFQFFGPKHDLLHGPLGDSIKLSIYQKQQIKSGAKTLAKKLEEMNLKIEEEVMNSFIDLLDKERQEKAKEVLGNKMHKSICVGVLLSHLLPQPLPGQ